MEFVRGWILNIVSIILIISFIEIILPDNSTKKFINLALGFVIVLVVVTPIVKVINKDIDMEEAVFSYTNSINKHEYVFNAERVLESNDEQFLSLYKDRIKEDIKFRVESRYDLSIKDIELNIEQKDQDNLGEILDLKILVEESNTNKTIPIVKIDISDVEEELEDVKIENVVKENIAQDISSIYNLDSNNIVVSE